LLATLKQLRDLGNTVIVVEHDEEAIRAADHVVDLGPGAGAHGGELVAQGTPADVEANPASITGQYLSGRRRVDVPGLRTVADPARQLHIVGARGNNLRNVSADIPLGLFTCVTGVSGSGKSTLIIDTLFGHAAARLSRARGYDAGRFSFNVKGGRCEACQGDGVIRVEMHFLPDVYVPCDVCHGKRY